MALAGSLLSHANTDGPKAMEAYLLDWVNLLLRWTHVIVGIAWIGSSFYFVFLDFSLKKPTDPASSRRCRRASCGRFTAAASTTRRSTLSRRKSLLTTCTGSIGRATGPGCPASRSSCAYLFNASTFLIDKNVHDWSPARRG